MLPTVLISVQTEPLLHSYQPCILTSFSVLLKFYGKSLANILTFLFPLPFCCICLAKPQVLIYCCTTSLHLKRRLINIQFTLDWLPREKSGLPHLASMFFLSWFLVASPVPSCPIISLPSILQLYSRICKLSPASASLHVLYPHIWSQTLSL